MKNAPEFFGGLGFAPGVVTGLRNWKIDGMGRLTGVVYKASVWRPGENLAECLKKRYAGTNSYSWAGLQVADNMVPVNPDPHKLTECEHGFYAYYDGSRDYHERGDVTGIIEGYGETIIGTRGFRCMKARIVALKPSGSIAVQVVDRLKRLYSGVEFFKDFHAMLAAHPTDAAGLEYNPETDPDFWSKEA